MRVEELKKFKLPDESGVYVPEVAWNFYVDGYQPAQKWLKDKKGRELTSEEIEHYQQIIIALAERSRIMNEIDNVLVS